MQYIWMVLYYWYTHTHIYLASPAFSQNPPRCRYVIFAAGPAFSQKTPRCRYVIYPAGPTLLVWMYIAGICMESAVYLAGPGFLQNQPPGTDM